MCILGAIFQCPFSTSEIEISECERISSLSSDYKGSFQNNFKKLTLIWRQLYNIIVKFSQNCLNELLGLRQMMNFKLFSQKNKIFGDIAGSPNQAHSSLF